MRNVFAALALAGVVLSCAPASGAAGYLDDRAQITQGASARDVTRAKRCAPPFGCAKKRRASSAAMLAMIDVAATHEGILADLARALVAVESGGNPALRGRHGEIGLTQIKCQTARGLGFAGPCAALFDPAVNLKWGLKHAHLAVRRGSIGFHQSGLHARHVSRRYVARIHAAMR